jgi:metallophosphoesterase (TIGR00282 family)
VLNLQGRVFMTPIDDPFRKADSELAQLPEDVAFVFVDMHAETTSEKQAMGYFCDGRASLVVGTHTHVPTADLRILPGGTAYITDVGMTGDFNSIIGMNKEEPLQRFLRRISSARFEPASGPATLCAIVVDTDPASGLAARVAPVRLGGVLEAARPTFWD